MKTVVGVFFGGKSVEHEVSIISASQVINVLNKEKYDVIPIYISKNNKFFYSEKMSDVTYFKDLENVQKESTELYFVYKNSKMIAYNVNSMLKKEVFKLDICFPVVHGLNVEDGTLQGFLEMYNIPYVGPDVSASAVGMNKIMFKKVLEASNIPVIEYDTVNLSEFEDDKEAVYNKITKHIALPIILKPANLGSSVGIEIVRTKEEFNQKMENVFLFTDKILVERCVTNLREIPAELDEEKENTIYTLSKKVFTLLDCEGICRIDYIIDVDQDKVYVNEINTIPGSLSFYLWEKKGLPFDELCDKLIKIAIKRSERRQKITYSNDVNILNMSGKK